MANNGPGRPEKKIQSTDTDESQDLEKTLEDATSGVVEAAKTNSTTLVVGVLFLLALISLPSLLGRIEEQKIQSWNDQIDAWSRSGKKSSSYRTTLLSLMNLREHR